VILLMSKMVIGIRRNCTRSWRADSRSHPTMIWRGSGSEMRGGSHRMLEVAEGLRSENGSASCEGVARECAALGEKVDLVDGLARTTAGLLIVTNAASGNRPFRSKPANWHLPPSPAKK
jgi:hypothetical protein